MNSKKLLSILSIVFLTVGGASAQIFYKVSGNGLGAPSYIFGTHHMAPLSVAEAYNLTDYIDRSEKVVGEIDMTQGQMALALAMQSHLMAPADSTLSKVLSPEDFELANEEFKKWAPLPGIDLKMFEPMKPMVVSTTMTLGVMKQLMPEFDENRQLDTYFQTYGKENGKEITGLETPEFQAGLLYDFTPISVQAEDLMEMVRNPEKGIETAKKLNTAYLKGDLEAMIELQEEDGDPGSEFSIALIDKRNADWLTKLPSIMNEGPAFITVGALHLAGEKGVIEGLKNMGYTIEPIEAVVAIPVD